MYKDFYHRDMPDFVAGPMLLPPPPPQYPPPPPPPRSSPPQSPRNPPPPPRNSQQNTPQAASGPAPGSTTPPPANLPLPSAGRRRTTPPSPVAGPSHRRTPSPPTPSHQGTPLSRRRGRPSSSFQNIPTPPPATISPQQSFYNRLDSLVNAGKGIHWKLGKKLDRAQAEKQRTQRERLLVRQERLLARRERRKIHQATKDGHNLYRNLHAAITRSGRGRRLRRLLPAPRRDMPPTPTASSASESDNSGSNPPAAGHPIMVQIPWTTLSSGSAGPSHRPAPRGAPTFSTIHTTDDDVFFQTDSSSSRSSRSKRKR